MGGIADVFPRETSLAERSKERWTYQQTGGRWSRGRAWGACPPSLIFRPNWGLKARKNFFETAPPRLIIGSGWPGPPPHLNVWIHHCRLPWWNNLSNSVFWKRDVGFHFYFFSREARSHNLRARIRGLFFGFVGILLPFVLLVNFLASSSAKGTLDNFVGKNVSEKLHVYAVSAILSSTSQC